jgi:hypothetical protein
MVLAMVYITQDYWTFGLCLWYGGLKNSQEHNFSETGSVSTVRWGMGVRYCVGSGRYS